MEYFEEILKAESISKQFGGLKALNDISFHVKRGEVFGIVGPNGAGKTTLFNVISGLIKPNGGKLIYKGLDITRFNAFSRAQIGIGRTFQVVRPFRNMTVLESVVTSLGKEFYRNLFVSLKRWKTQVTVEMAEGILKDVGLIDLKDRNAAELPLGLQRKLEIARALALTPELILLDESFSGLSFSEMDELKELVVSLNKKGITIIIIEHNMPVVMELCERVMVINYGKKIAEGSPTEVVNNREVIEAYLGRKYH